MAQSFHAWVKEKNRQELTVAYLGGSITLGHHHEKCWPFLVTEWMRQTVPEASFRYVNAGVGGTPSTLGVYRLQQDVLAAKPDLVFVEFAINDRSIAEDASQAAMEEITRRCLEQGSFVIYLYTTNEKGNEVSAIHDSVAQHYSIPTISVQPKVREVLASAEVSWSELFKDICHPTDKGHELYASIVIEHLEGNIDFARATYELPERKYPEVYEHPTIIRDSQCLTQSAGWSTIPSCLSTRYRASEPVNAWVTQSPGEWMELAFTGTGIGFLHSVGSHGGMLECTIDDGETVLVDTFFAGGPGPYTSFKYHVTGLPKGEHKLRIQVSEEKHEESSDHYVQVVYFVVS